MYRRRMRTISHGAGFNSDSLMDVLACTIGLIIIIMLLAVIGAEKIAFSFTIPIINKNTQGKKGLDVFCLDGKIRVLDFSPAYKIINDLPFKIEPSSYPVIVKFANKEKQVIDAWFKYSFNCDGYGKGTKIRSKYLYLVVEEIQEGSGEVLDDLKAGYSQFNKALQTANVDSHWIMFHVDTESIELFREVRKICLDKGYATGWQPSPASTKTTINKVNNITDSTILFLIILTSEYQMLNHNQNQLLT